MPPAYSTSLITLDTLMVPGTLGPFEQEQACRRLTRLLSIGTLDNRQGGTGKATKVFNCFGEALCLKSLARVSRMGKTEDEVNRTFLSRAIAFKGEYSCQRSLIGLPGIPRVYGYGTYAGGPVIVMEWVQASPLRETFKDQHLPAWQCAHVGARVVAILLAARQRNPHFVHRDLSGHNILVRNNANRSSHAITNVDLCIIDYGSAVDERVHEQHQETDIPTIWRNATPEYAPPEMLTHSDPRLLALRNSQKIDVYELCGVLWEIYWGITPYQLSQRKTRAPYLLKLEHHPLRPNTRAHVNEDFVRILEAGLEPAPGNRPTLRELWQALTNQCERQDTSIADALRNHLSSCKTLAQQPLDWGATVVREA